MAGWLVYACVWLLLGLLADKLCEGHAKKEGRQYEKSTAVACYIAGPLVIPVALAWAIGKGIVNMLRH